MFKDDCIDLSMDINELSSPVRTQTRQQVNLYSLKEKLNLLLAFVDTSFGLCIRHLSAPSGTRNDDVLAPADIRLSSSDSTARLRLQGWT